MEARCGDERFHISAQEAPHGAALRFTGGPEHRAQIGNVLMNDAIHRIGLAFATLTVVVTVGGYIDLATVTAFAAGGGAVR
jgi:hypothetical protein